MNALTFPGLAANLNVETVSPLPDPQDAHAFQRLWVFKNQEKNPASLLNRVEILEDHGAHFLINVFFKAAGCDQMKKTFSDLGEKSFSFYHFFHEQGFCQLTSSNPTSMKTVLNRIIEGNKFEGLAQKEMMSIVEMIQKEEAPENTSTPPISTPTPWYGKAWVCFEKTCSNLWRFLKWLISPCARLFSRTN